MTQIWHSGGKGGGGRYLTLEGCEIVGDRVMPTYLNALQTNAGWAIASSAVESSWRNYALGLYESRDRWSAVALTGWGAALLITLAWWLA